MPAVTPEDTTALPRIAAPAGPARAVRGITTAPTGVEGEGFPVRRAFAGVPLATLDPFIHLDQMGSVEYGPGEPKGTPWHPHRGFETVTYMIDGLLRHEDSTGGGGLIRDGGTQWMTAGSGILHIETPPDEVVAAGGLFHGCQLWVNLPSSKKWLPPAYQGLEPEAVVLLTTPDAGVVLRLIAGDLAGRRGPGTTHSPMTMVHASAAPGARLEVPWPEDFNALVYVLAGSGFVGAERAPLGSGQLAVLGAGSTLVAEAATGQSTDSPNLELLLLGGRPIGEPVKWMGPFVMNTDDELRQAVEDFEAGRLGRIPERPAPHPDEVAFTTDSPLD